MDERQAAGGFDTLAAARAMEAAGVERRQAEGIAATIRDAVTPDAATKADVAKVRAEIAELRSEFRAAIAALEVRLVKIVFFVAGGQAAVIVALLKLLE